jgi:hypothetical protein
MICHDEARPCWARFALNRIDALPRAWVESGCVVMAVAMVERLRLRWAGTPAIHRRLSAGATRMGKLLKK